MARRTSKKRRTTKRRKTKTLAQRVTALENAIKPKAAPRGRKVRHVASSEPKHFTPPHLLRQLNG